MSKFVMEENVAFFEGANYLLNHKNMRKTDKKFKVSQRRFIDYEENNYIWNYTRETVRKSVNCEKQ